MFFLQQRDILIIQVFLSVAGMLVIGLALGASFGLCFYIGLSINDVCPVIPFLLLGIGDSIKKSFPALGKGSDTKLDEFSGKFQRGVVGGHFNPKFYFEKFWTFREKICNIIF